MLVRFFATVLVALTFLPFTAPFPACDFASLTSSSPSGGHHGTLSNRTVADGASTHALPSTNRSLRIRAMVGPAFRRHADRPLQLSTVRPASLHPISTPSSNHLLAALRI
jgi:hypothetical protein